MDVLSPLLNSRVTGTKTLLNGETRLHYTLTGHHAFYVWRIRSESSWFYLHLSRKMLAHCPPFFWTFPRCVSVADLRYRIASPSKPGLKRPRKSKHSLRSGDETISSHKVGIQVPVRERGGWLRGRMVLVNLASSLGSTSSRRTSPHLLLWLGPPACKRPNKLYHASNAILWMSTHSITSEKLGGWEGMRVKRRVLITSVH